jgi:hypothetical protein
MRQGSLLASFMAFFLKKLKIKKKKKKKEKEKNKSKSCYQGKGS